MNIPLNHFCPEIIMIVAACIVALVGVAKSDAVRRSAQWISLISLILAFIAGVRIGMVDSTPAWPLASFATYDTLLASGIGILLVLLSWDMPFAMDPAKSDQAFRGEYFAMMLVSLAGVSMMAKVDNLIWLFIALELVSIPTYIMVATGRSNPTAQEAGIKYFFLGSLSAAVYLFGFSYLYGFSGSTDFSKIASAFAAAPQLPYIAIIGLLMVAIGIAYKIAAVPLHYYAPDVYQGTATPVTAFLSFAPKAAGFIALILVFNLTGWRLSHGAARAVPDLLMVMAVLSMTIGNVLALLQRNIKRMLAYSSISHSGYMLVGLAVGPLMISHSITNGVSAMLFYLGAYSVMTVGAFAVLVYLQGKLDAAEDLDDIAGIASAHPLAAACMAVCMLSLIGMPFTVGFLGKLFIVQAAFSSGHGALAVIVMINAAIAAAYYLSIITSMYLRDPWTPFAVRRPGAIQFSAAIAAALVILLGVFPSVLMSISRYSGTEVTNMVVVNNSQTPAVSKTTAGMPPNSVARSRSTPPTISHSTPLASTHTRVAAAL